MALLDPKDRVLETSTTTSTGTYTLAGAVTGFQTAASAGAINGTTGYYYAEDVDANGVPLGGWETGLGTWGTGGTLARTTIHTSSNANAAVSWAAGTRRISFAVLTATQLRDLNAHGKNSGGGYSVATVASAFSVGGSYSSGVDSFAGAIADNTSSYGAQGPNSVAFGQRGKATGTGAFSFSSGTGMGVTTSLASGNYSLAFQSGQSTGAGSISGGAGQLSGSATTASGTGSVSFSDGGVSSGTSSYSFGLLPSAVLYGKYAYASGAFASAGDAQTAKMVLRKSTTDATPAVLTSNNGAAGTTNQLILLNNQGITFMGMITARQNTTGDTASWNVSGCIKRGANAAATALVGTIVSLASAADAGAVLWTAVLTADTTNGGLAVTVTGEAAKTIRWSITIFANELAG